MKNYNFWLKMNKYQILSTKTYSKHMKLYINRFVCIIRIFCRKPIEKIFRSSKDMREKLKKNSNSHHF